VLEHLGRVPGALVVPALRHAADGQGCVQVEHEGASYLVRVLTYLDGVPLRESAVRPYDVGRAVAQMQHSLQGFFHPAAGRQILWDLRRLAELRPLVEEVEGFDGYRVAPDGASVVYSRRQPADDDKRGVKRYRGAAKIAIEGDETARAIAFDRGEPAARGRPR